MSTIKRNTRAGRTIFDNDKDRGTFKLRTIKKRKPNDEFILVDNWVGNAKQYARISAETVALDLCMEVHSVKQCFHKLNLDGKLSQGLNESPNSMHMRHDWGDAVCQWHPTKYEVLK